MRTYRALCSGLADDSGFELPRDLAADVVTRLGLNARPPRVALPADMLLVAGAIVCAVIVALSCLDWRPFVDTLVAIRASLLQHASPPLESTRGFLVDLNHTLTVAVAGIAILVCMAGIDAVFLRKKPIR
jgi:hypothetical protein